VSNIAQPTPEELEQFAEYVRNLPTLEAVVWEWDFKASRVTIKQKRSHLSIHPEQVTLTFETLTLAYYIMLKTSLELSGVMQQMGPITHEPHKPSGGKSESPRSHTARG
jgi:hypothetical protein